MLGRNQREAFLEVLCAARRFSTRLEPRKGKGDLRPILSPSAHCEFQRVQRNLIPLAPIFSRKVVDGDGDRWLGEDLG